MKTGRTLNELAAELQRQAETRRDYVAAQGALAVVPTEHDITLTGLSPEPLTLTANAHQQIGDHLRIPRDYYERMRATQPALLADNVNTWLKATATEKRMVRTLDGKARAFLSPKYRPLDNFELAQAVLPVLIQQQVEVKSCEITETRMFIKAILPGLSDELPAGLEWGVGHHIFAATETRRVVAAITISNSEVGAGSLQILPSVFTAVCTNLAILKEQAMRKYHIGRSFGADEDYTIYRDETRKADDRAFWLKARDSVTSALSAEKFAAAIAAIKAAGERKITSEDLPTVVDITAKKLKLTDGTQNSILAWLAKGGQMNAWGLSSAITRAAQDVEDYTTATELEKAGGEVLGWTDAEFEVVNKAA